MIRFLIFVIMSGMFQHINADMRNTDKALRTNMGSMTFRNDTMNNPRIGTPVYQLQCNGPLCGKGYEYAMPSLIEISEYGRVIRIVIENATKYPHYNVMFGRSRADLPKPQCDGYDFQDDPVISKSSCRLPYELRKEEDLADVCFFFVDAIIVAATIVTYIIIFPKFSAYVKDDFIDLIFFIGVVGVSFRVGGMYLPVRAFYKNQLWEEIYEN